MNKSENHWADPGWQCLIRPEFKGAQIVGFCNDYYDERGNWSSTFYAGNLESAQFNLEQFRKEQKKRSKDVK